MSMQQGKMQQQQQRWLSGKSPLTIDAVVPDERTATQLVTDFSQDQVVREVTFRRETDGTPHIRISLRPEAVPQFQDRLAKLTDAIQRSYETAGYGQ